MRNFGHFGPLLGVITITNSYCKFLVYAAQNAEILTCHEIKLKIITKEEPGCIEYDPVEIWRSVCECIEFGTKNLIFLDINPNDIVGMGITNQRGTTVLWNKETGLPLYNAIAWCDTRTSSTIDLILSKIKNKKNLLKSVCGLTISTHFSAIKIKWLLENIDKDLEFVKSKCYFGTLDTWIIWNLTGGIKHGVHATDVTNASHTMLMNLGKLIWDKKLCAFFEIPMNILPTVKSCSEIYGYIDGGPLNGVPISGCIGDQQSALLGQMCLSAGQIICTYDESGSIVFNTGQEIIDSSYGLLSTVGFQLGPKRKIYYALEGVIASVGSCLTWLQESLDISIELKTSNQNISSNLIFVPAFCGLCSPHWNHDVRGAILGLNSNTTSQEIVLSAYESICYQTHEVLDSIKKDCKYWAPINKLIVGGEFSDDFHLLQMVSDLCGIDVERPQTSHPSCIGAMIAAGLAMDVLTLENNKIMSCYLYAAPSDIFSPVICSNQREIRYSRWKTVVSKYLEFDHRLETGTNEFDTTTNSNNNENSLLTIRNSIPGGLFLFTSFAILKIAQYLNSSSAIIF